jgi:hypothetical protein
MTTSIETAFQRLEALSREQPRKKVQLQLTKVERFLAASDAALERPREGTGGYLLVWNPQQQHQRREGTVVTIPQRMYDMWDSSPWKSAQQELPMVLVGLLSDTHSFRGARGIWFIDNVAALMAVVRGRSDNRELDHLAGMIHAVLFSLQTWMYFEWIQSKSNWADGISRYGSKDSWHARHNFSCREVSVPLEVWHLPFRGVIRVAEFL